MAPNDASLDRSEWGGRVDGSLTLSRISGTFSIDSVRIQAGCVALSFSSLLRRAAPITQNNMQWQTTWASSELVVKLLNATGYIIFIQG